MEEVSKGVYESNGFSVGFIPIISKDEVKKRKINKYSSFIVNTGMDQRMRIPLFIRSVDAIIVVNGGKGTWLEACHALANEIPIITIKNTGGIADELINNDNFKNKISICTTPNEVIDKLNQIFTR